MAAHAAVSGDRRRISAPGRVGPATIGVPYGLCATTVARHGGPAALNRLWLGLAAFAVTTVAAHCSFPTHEDAAGRPAPH
ncbi:hypothetical protein [Streptomyces bikiniensis]|uniref:hypothetical protein n=1 Tax=Streptomyces bikiniensis TaxID=1896 RepID=UPI000691CB5B|nr:hypothetical protein [Streptomyces bikiniensis]